MRVGERTVDGSGSSAPAPSEGDDALAGWWATFGACVFGDSLLLSHSPNMSPHTEDSNELKKKARANT